MTDRVDRVGQVWEVVSASKGPWLVLAWSADGFDIMSWEIVSLSSGQRGRALESSFLKIERGSSDVWERLL